MRINLGQRKGKLTFEFASVEDLDRIVSMMGGDLVVDTGLSVAGFGDEALGDTSA